MESIPHIDTCSVMVHFSRKHAIETIDTFDFLREIVAAVPDPTNGGQIPEDGGSDDGAAPRKRRTRRTKAEMEADAAQ